MSKEEMMSADGVAYAMISYASDAMNKRILNYEKNKDNVCVRARWASPGPCSGGSSYDFMFTSTDNIHSIIPLSKETFSERYYPYGQDIR